MPPIAEQITPTANAVASGALAVNRRVYLNSSNKVAYAGESNPGLGTTKGIAAADGDPIPVTWDNANGIVAMTASAAITAGANVYEAANGKVAPTPTSGQLVGVAATAASADGDEIQVIPTKFEPIVCKTGTSAGATLDIDTGFGANPDFAIFQVTNAAGADKAGTSITWLAGVATVAGLAATDVVRLFARRFTK